MTDENVIHYDFYMSIKITVLTLTTVAVLLPLRVHAQTVEPTTTEPTTAEATTIPGNKIHDLRERVKVGPTIHEVIRTIAARESIKDTVTSILQQQKAQRLQERMNFQSKLALIKDEKKKALVEKIDTKIASISAKDTTRMANAVTQLDEILTKIKDQAATAKQTGKDTTALDAAIADADKAISSASAGIKVQATKTYTLNITSESTLRNNVGVTVRQLEMDLKNTYKLVIAAKQAVQKAGMELKKLSGEVKPTGMEETNTTMIPSATPAL